MRRGRPAFVSASAHRSSSSGRALNAPRTCGFSARSALWRSKLKVEVRIDRALALQESVAEIVRQSEIRQRDFEQLGIGADPGALPRRLDEGGRDPAPDDRVLRTADQAGIPRLAHDELRAVALNGGGARVRRGPCRLGSRHRRKLLVLQITETVAHRLGACYSTRALVRGFGLSKRGGLAGHMRQAASSSCARNAAICRGSAYGPSAW